MVSRVSVSVPIWLSLMRIELPTPRLDALAQARGVGDEEVVADELDLACRACAVSACQPSQSSSARPSSIETIG